MTYSTLSNIWRSAFVMPETELFLDFEPEA